MKHFHRISFCIVLILIFTVGCGKKPVVLSLYCSASHLPVAEELAKTFRLVYGVTVVCIPTDDATHPVFSGPEESASKKTKSRYEIQREKVLDSDEVRQLKKWIENARYKDFGQYLLDHKFGDLYLCDSPVEVQKLVDGEFAMKTRPLVHVTPVLMVHPEQGTETLGIVRREVGGLGRETDRILQNLRDKDTNLNFSQVTVFDNETLLLKAWEESQIAVAICWDSTAARLFPEIEPVALPRPEVLAVPLTICDLRSGGDYKIMEFFSIFASSEKGRSFFQQSGYKVK